MRDRKVPPRQSLGERIRALRGDRSRDSFAGELGIHKNTLARYEAGHRMPDAALLQRLCRMARVPPAWLLDGVESRATRFVEPTMLAPAPGAPALKLNRDWLREHRLDPDVLHQHRMQDNSMAPTLCRGELILVERGSPLPPPAGGLIVVRLDGDHAVRRVHPQTGGLLRLACDNPEYPAVTVREEALHPGGSHELVGSVCWQLRRLDAG